MTSNYPEQVFSLKQEKQGVFKTLGIDAMLSAVSPKLQDVGNPMEIHNAFSRFVVTLIHKGETTVHPKCNIPARDVDYIAEKTKIAMQLLANKQCNPSANTSDDAAQSKAYTTVISVGRFKGKTPAQWLTEDPSRADDMKQTADWLMQNAAKFAANKIQADAINEALALAKEGKLKKTAAAPASSAYVLYEEDTKPLRSTKNEAGEMLITGIKIICDTSRRLPFAITVSNYWAPVVVKDNGAMNVVGAKAHDAVSVTMNMTERDWYRGVTAMKSTLDNFERMYFKTMFNLSREISKENREKATTKGE